MSDAAKQMAADAEGFTLSLDELAKRDLTMREVALLFNNHSQAMYMLEQIVENQEKRITTLLYTLAAYMQQYPLDIEKLKADNSTSKPQVVEAPINLGGYL